VEVFGRDVAREIWGLTAENVGRMRGLAERFDIAHEEVGASYFATDEAEAGRLRQSAMMLQKDRFDVDFVDGDPLDRGFLATQLQPGDFGTQPAQLAYHLAHGSGAALYENDEVSDIQREGPGLVVRTRQRDVRCEQVIIAVNGYAGLLDPFFLPLVEPARGQILVTEPLPRIVDTLGLVHQGCYFRQLSDGRFLIGGGRHQFIDEERTYSDAVTHHVQGFIRGFLERHFPEANIEVSRRWGGIHGMTSDGLPIVGHLPNEPEVYFAVGFSGHGNSLGLMAGERVVEMMVHGREPGVLSVGRFE
jgi:glycine/D-amino acid oxidase-like deaminating enzyme